MKLEQFFTENDPNISGDTNIDGLGLRIVWSAHGYSVYNSYINSISNDVRNYTVDVLNHWVIKSLCEDTHLELNAAIGSSNGNKHSRSFKQSCILFLENLYTYILVEANENRSEGISTSGVLGSSNAIRNWRKQKESNNELYLYLSTSEKAQVLVRQISLGVNGRYKAPMRNLKFFKDEYLYYKTEPGSTWYAVEHELAKAWPQFAELKTLLVKLMSILIRNSEKEPSIGFSDIDKKIKSLYLENLGNPKVVGGHSREFWLTRTQLNKGVAGKVGEALKPYLDGENPLDLRDVYEKVLANITDAGEKKIVEDIILIEPFMEHLDLMFHLMCCTEVTNLVDLEIKWKEFGREADSLKNLVNKFTPNERILSDSGLARIKKCIRIADAGSIQDQAKALEEYHVGLMQNRGQQAWIKILKDGSIQKNIHSLKMPDKAKRYPGSWVNSYYVGAHLHFLRGLGYE